MPKLTNRGAGSGRPVATEDTSTRPYTTAHPYYAGVDLHARSLFAHVTDQALVNVSPEAYDRVMDTYRNPFVGLLEIGLAVLIIFHALNGLRIILFDFWSKGIARQRQMLWLQTVLFVLLAVPPVVAIGGKVIQELRA